MDTKLTAWFLYSAKAASNHQRVRWVRIQNDHFGSESTDSKGKIVQTEEISEIEGQIHQMLHRLFMRLLGMA
jgi:hypothetical protein